MTIGRFQPIPLCCGDQAFTAKTEKASIPFFRGWGFGNMDYFAYGRRLRIVLFQIPAMPEALKKSKASISRLQTMAKVFSESGDKWLRRKNSVRRLIGASAVYFV